MPFFPVIPNLNIFEYRQLSLRPGFKLSFCSVLATGTKFEYSGGGSTISQLIIENISGIS